MILICDKCGQRTSLDAFKDGDDCTQLELGGNNCPGKFRDPNAPVINTPTPVPDEVPTNPGKKKIAQHSSKGNEHFTPPEIIEVARKVMGGIHLDPASCGVANTIVKADHYFTKADDALNRPWAGEVWCNPPGGKLPGTNNSQAQAFFYKAVDEFEAGRVKVCCFLGFTLELLRLTQTRPPSACEFAFCILKERADFLVENSCPLCGLRSATSGEACATKKCPGITANDGKILPGGQPTHANVLVLISKDKAMIRKFYVEAQVLGAVVVNADLVL